jgi:hypothetical protein
MSTGIGSSRDTDFVEDCELTPRSPHRLLHSFVVARPVPAFMIVGTARSGTTLVQRLASELPGVVVPPETHFFSHFAPDLLRRATFPLARPELETELARYTAIKSCRGLGLDEAAVVERLGGRCESPFELFAAIVGVLAGEAEVVGEKTPEHLIWWRPLAQAFPGLSFVAVVRDPRGVVGSNLAVPFGMDSPAILAERWAADQRCLDAARDALGSRMLLLRYETVVNDPTAARDAVARHLGVAADASVKVSKTAYLSWETWKEGVDDEVTSSRIEAWRDELTERDADIVTALCRKGMERFGYPDGPGRVTSALVLARLRPGEQWRRGHYRASRRRLERLVAGVTP